MRNTIVAAALVSLSAACGSADPTEPAAAQRATLAVTTAPAAMMQIAERLEAGGVVTAAASAAVSSRVLAPVMEVRVRAGDRVRAGQVLIVLDDRDLAAHARQAGASVTAAEQSLGAARADNDAAIADLTLASAWHKRIASLHGRNSATAQELDEATARLAAASARVASGRARIEQATAALAAARAGSDAASTTQSFSTLTAPFGGVVTERLVDPGHMAAPGTPLLRLDAGGVARVEARVDEARIPYVRVGDTVEVLADAEEGGAVDGVVAEIARVDAATRAFTVKVALPEGHPARSGTFARIRFAGPARRALVVPAGALRRQGQVNTVFVVQQGIARLRLVQTGQAEPDRVEILAGLEDGERVVVRPPPALADGQPVGDRP